MSARISTSSVLSIWYTLVKSDPLNVHLVSWISLLVVAIKVWIRSSSINNFQAFRTLFAFFAAPITPGLLGMISWALALPLFFCGWLIHSIFSSVQTWGFTLTVYFLTSDGISNLSKFDGSNTSSIDFTQWPFFLCSSSLFSPFREIISFGYFFTL